MSWVIPIYDRLFDGGPPLRVQRSPGLIKKELAMLLLYSAGPYHGSEEAHRGFEELCESLRHCPVVMKTWHADRAAAETEQTVCTSN